MKPLDEHVVSVRRVRQRVDQAVETLKKAQEFQEQALAITQEIMFDHLCRCRDSLSEMEDLSEVSSVVARTVQSIQRLQELKEKQPEQKRKTVELAGLPPELREELEQDLKLM